MNFFERKPAANLPDKIFVKQECKLPNIPLPISESEYFRTKSVGASANGPAPLDLAKSRPINTQEFTPAVETNSDIHRLEHIVTGPLVSTIPGDEASIPSSKPSKKKSRFGGIGIVICAMLSLVTGIAVGAAWSPHSLTENLKSYNFRGVLETIFADSSKGHPTAQATVASVAAPDLSEIQNQVNAIARSVSSMQPAPAASVTAPDFSEIQNQLNAITRTVSSMQQNINDLAVGQEQIRKAQWQLAGAQQRLVNLQTLANAKQNKQPDLPATRGSR